VKKTKKEKKPQLPAVFSPIHTVDSPSWTIGNAKPELRLIKKYKIRLDLDRS
jgi:hypothetical protein